MKGHETYVYNIIIYIHNSIDYNFELYVYIYVYIYIYIYIYIIYIYIYIYDIPNNGDSYLLDFSIPF